MSLKQKEGFFASTGVLIFSIFPRENDVVPLS